MDTGDEYGIWSRKGSTLSDRSARKEFGLSQEEIVKAIKAGKLQYRVNSMHGNPYLRLLRHEVEALVRGRRGEGFLENARARKRLAEIDKEVRSLKRRIVVLEKERANLMKESKQ